MTASSNFTQLISLYKFKEIEFPNLKSISIAMWILESNWGNSDLAKVHNNFAGIKYRKEMENYASKIFYEAHDGKAAYCHFQDLNKFLDGYWAFLERIPYKGWKNHTENAESFISFVGPIWAEDKSYVEKVIDLLDDAEALLSAAGSPTAKFEKSIFTCIGCGPGEETLAHKPKVDRLETTTQKASRNGTDIDHIVIHYTTSRKIDGTIEHFKNAPIGHRTSAHYIIGQDGALVQMMSDTDCAWHSGNKKMNERSIGIEHVAKLGDEITSDQAKKSSELIKWLMAQYDIPKENIIPHVCVHSTDCCGDLFTKFGGGAGKNCKDQTNALHAWLTSVGI